MPRLRISGAIPLLPPTLLHILLAQGKEQFSALSVPYIFMEFMLRKRESACNCSRLCEVEMYLARLRCTVLRHWDNYAFSLCIADYSTYRNAFWCPAKNEVAELFLFYKTVYVKSSSIRNTFGTPVLQTLNYSKRKQVSKTHFFFWVDEGAFVIGNRAC